MKLNTLHTIGSLKGKRVIIRADLNVPTDDSGRITDDTRIRAAIPTIKYVIEQEGKAIVMSHLGRPGGEKIASLSLAPVARRLSELLGRNVAFSPDCIGDAAEKMTSRMVNGDIVLLENLRFHKGEMIPGDEPDFTKELAKLGDVYINDAFATAHRKHASTYELPKFFDFPVAGFLIEKEVLILTNLLTQAQSPFYAIIGGSKISSKIGVLDALLSKVDGLFIGGAMIFTFMKALGYNIGNSLLDEEHIDTAKHLIKRMKSKGVQLFLPKDILIANAISQEANTKVVFIEEGIENGWTGVDIGPQTCIDWKAALDDAGTIFWNGPVGIFEIESFSQGTINVAKILADSQAMTIVGGGDSAAAIYKCKMNQKITRISTGGGAALEFIEFGTLPVLEILSQ